jgi:transporter family-2 protein
MRALLFALAGAAGVAAASQGAANAALTSRTGLGAALFFNSVVVLIGTAVMLLFTGGVRSLGALGGAPLPHYLGAFCGLFIITAVTLAFPRLGSMALALMVLGQGVMALVIEHFGLWGMTRVPVSGPRLLGVALVLAGVLLLKR